ncbi:hypothetical protein GCM10011613_25910 [Cellvibrio zantedeschiae]|uniref:HTH araC/xylS-type domain-containing protein n=1 Tax=Cellvibrio zantedeschiae TaxID=1237077 RepID=A0ABQ3B5F6_9GAMM|nr:helix-turn-helix domain-containing protein [Cellvibrio zantedeschiae]GGY79772.1 hypothetical protein GCM10011613_25910 [Cellvibrio zantedeschiae]
MAGLILAVSLLTLLLFAPLMMLGKSRAANRWLAAYLLCLSLIGFSEYADVTRLYLEHPRLWGWFDLAFTLIGITYYQYANALMGRSFKPHQLWHFLPFAIVFGIVALTHFSVGREELIAAIIADEQTTSGDNTWTLFFQGMALAYMLAVIFRLYQFRQLLKQNFSSLKTWDLHWLFWITLANAVMLLLWFTANQSNAGLALQLGCRLVLVYALVWYGIKQRVIFIPPAIDHEKINLDAPDELEEKYSRSGLTESAAELIEKRLQRIMKSEQRFLEPNLTLNQLADAVGASPQWLSQYINQYHQCNFFDYVNSFRVNHVQQLIRESIDTESTLLDLALAAGFNTKSTFNSSFKKITGYTPSNWRKQVKNMSTPICSDEITA